LALPLVLAAGVGALVVVGVLIAVVVLLMYQPPDNRPRD
jgi:hypothetical protein